MGPTTSKIKVEDIRPGLRFAWREQPDTIIVNIFMILTVSGLLVVGGLGLLTVLAVALVLVYGGDLAHLLYSGLAGARDARDFDAYINSQYPPNVDPSWFPLFDKNSDTE